MKDLLIQAKDIYSNLNDDISRNVFLMRLQYFVTGDLSIVSKLDERYRNLNSDIECFAKSIKKGKRNFIYGAGQYGKTLAKSFPFLNIESFIDSYRKEKLDKETGIKIQDVVEFKKSIGNEIETVKVFIAICNVKIAQEVKCLLQNQVGIPEDNLVMCIHEYRNNTSQYFDFFEPHQDEVFVDCGCYDGATCFKFAGWCGDLSYNHIYSFEPDKTSYDRCKRTLQNLGKCEIYPYGIGRKNEKRYFSFTGREDARIITQQMEKEFLDADIVQTISLDEFLEGKRITFIKMDIEGAEWDALHGAERIIREQKPRLAISVYHCMEDFIRIPKFILELNPAYRISFRHYSLFEGETIMYAE